jgi:hypothetical protein
VVFGHHALKLEAKEILGPSASWPGQVGRTWVGRRLSKASVEGGQESLQDLVGFRQLARISTPQGFDQTVLKCAEKPFHTPLGLRAMGRDEADA